MKDFIIGIDPGKAGGIASKNMLTGEVKADKLPDTPGGLVDYLDQFPFARTVVYLENVMGNAGGCKTAQQGCSFGRGYGHLEMVCLALGIERRDVVPQTWQKQLGVGSKGAYKDVEWKRRLKERAERIFPTVKIINATADALLILDYGMWHQGVLDREESRN